MDIIIAGSIITIMLMALAFYLTWNEYSKNPELEKLKKPLIIISIIVGLVMLVNLVVLLRGRMVKCYERTNGYQHRDTCCTRGFSDIAIHRQ